MPAPSPGSICPECGSPIPGDVVVRQCPRCLLLNNLKGTGAIITSRSGTPEGTLPFTPQPQRSPSSRIGSGKLWEPPPPEAIQEALPKYDVISLLGRGGMGAVYKGVQNILGRTVAIKILPPGTDDAFGGRYADRFKSEARAMGSLSHPGIVRMFDFGETVDGLLYFVMEFVDGTDVGQLIKQSGRLPPDQALAIAAYTCDALGYAHGRGIVHRDIKPANLMVAYDGRVLVADFGLAKDLHQNGGLTRTNVVMGTPLFMAPEAMTDLKVDGRADLYSLGITLYAMLTGKVPRGIPEMPSQVIPGLDPLWDRIIYRSLRNDPNERYQTATEFRADLNRLKATLIRSRKNSGRSQVSVSRPPPKKKVPIGMIAQGIGISLLLAVLSLGIFELFHSRERKPQGLGPRLESPVVVHHVPETPAGQSNGKNNEVPTGKSPQTPKTPAQTARNANPALADRVARLNTTYEQIQTGQTVSVDRTIHDRWVGRHVEFQTIGKQDHPEALLLMIHLLDSTISQLTQIFEISLFLENDGRLLVREVLSTNPGLQGARLSITSSPNTTLGKDYLTKVLLEIEEHSAFSASHRFRELGVAFAGRLNSKISFVGAREDSVGWLVDGLGLAIFSITLSQSLVDTGLRGEVEDFGSIDMNEALRSPKWVNGVNEARPIDSRFVEGSAPFASLFLKLNEKFGDAFLKRFLTESLPSQPDSQSIQDAFDNVFVAAVRVAPNRGLETFFIDEWKWPVSDGARRAVGMSIGAPPSVPVTPVAPVPPPKPSMPTQPIQLSHPIFLTEELSRLLVRNREPYVNAMTTLGESYRGAVEVWLKELKGKPSDNATEVGEAVISRIDSFEAALKAEEVTPEEFWLNVPAPFPLPDRPGPEIQRLYGIWVREGEKQKNTYLRQVSKEIMKLEEALSRANQSQLLTEVRRYREFLTPPPGYDPMLLVPSRLISVSIAPDIPGDLPVRCRIGDMDGEILKESKMKRFFVPTGKLTNGPNKLWITTRGRLPTEVDFTVQNGIPLISTVSPRFKQTTYAKFEYVIRRTEGKAAPVISTPPPVWVAIGASPPEFAGLIRLELENKNTAYFKIVNTPLKNNAGKEEGGFQALYSYTETSLSRILSSWKNPDEASSLRSISFSTATIESYFGFHVSGPNEQSTTGVFKLLEIGYEPTQGEQVCEIW